MTSKIFKSAVSEGRLSIAEAPGGLFTVGIRRDGVLTDVVDLASSDASAISLAVLEAAGYEERQKGWDVMNSADENFAQAMRCLSKGIEIQERATAEAKERAELEAEALDYWKASTGVVDPASYNNVKWSDLTPEAQAKWLAVARRAREVLVDNVSV